MKLLHSSMENLLSSTPLILKSVVYHTFFLSFLISLYLSSLSSSIALKLWHTVIAFVAALTLSFDSLSTII